ncbi:MAG: hypothetical protein AB7N65_08460 [Vicinamibacterales bacterium]
MSPDALAVALEQSRLAAWVNSSKYVLGALSGAHLLGFTTVVGTALVAGLHMAGHAFAERPSAEVTRTTGRVLQLGLAVSVATGIALVSPRASGAIANWIFTLKMALLTAAVVAQLAVGRFARRADAGSPIALRAWAAVTAALWLAVGVAGCAFILLE